MIKEEGASLARVGKSFDMLSTLVESSFIGWSHSLNSSVTIDTVRVIRSGRPFRALTGLC